MTPYARAAAWTAAAHGTYAVLHRPDGTPAGRIHVIAEAEQIAKWINEAIEKERTP